MSLYRFSITAKNEGHLLRDFLRGRMPGMNPGRLDVAFYKGFIFLNGAPAKRDSVLQKGDEVSVDTSWFRKPRSFPEDVPLQIVQEDEHLIVLHKAPGMACHAGLGTYRGTLLNALAHYYARTGTEALENGLVHRLDKASSGLMVVAKTRVAFDFLKKEVQHQRVLRSYFVATTQPMPEQEGKVEKAIGRNPEDPMLIGIREDGKPAVTHYRLWEAGKERFIYQCRTQYGRTHQVRIHFASMGCPLLGDDRYGGEPAPRLFLCSSGLSFVHPVTLSQMDIQLEKPDFLS